MCSHQGDKDFTPAAAQVAHQKPQPSVPKLAPVQHINQQIHQPRKWSTTAATLTPPAGLPQWNTKNEDVSPPDPDLPYNQYFWWGLSCTYVLKW